MNGMVNLRIGTFQHYPARFSSFFSLFFQQRNGIMEKKLRVKPKSKFFLVITLTVIVFLAIVGRLLWYYWPHLWWKYLERKSELQHVEKILNHPMPITTVPEDWVEHSWNCLRFRLPPDMSLMAKPEGTFGGSSYDRFSNESIVITIGLTSLREPDPFLELASKVYPEKNFLTLSQLRLETFGVESSDFRWSMSRQEALRFVFLMTVRRVIVPRFINSTESFSGKNWDGLLLYGGSRGIAFDWQSRCCYNNGCFNGGRIGFSPLDEEQGVENLDINIIRGIVQSIEVVDCPCGCPTTLTDQN